MNKNVKITLLTIIIIIILLGIMFFIQWNNRINAGVIKPEVDIPANNKEEISGMIKIQDLPEEYGLINAINDKCVVSVHGRTIYNKDELDEFLENIKQNKIDFIRCVNFTIEGDPIITDVNFEGENTFKITVDSSRDNFGQGNYTYYTFKKINIEETEDETSITFTKAIEGEQIDFYLIGYDADVKIINNYKNDFLLDVKVNNKKNKEKITIGQLKDKYNYDIYYYGLDNVFIKINNEKIDLKEALKSGKVNMEDIINQVEKDFEIGIIAREVYKDGGSKEYYYNGYKIIKRNSINGINKENIKDVYIGIPEMSLNDVNN